MRRAASIAHSSIRKITRFSLTPWTIGGGRPHDNNFQPGASGDTQGRIG